MYGKNGNGVLYVRFEPTEGYKPMMQSEAPEAPAGCHPGFYWRETENAWVQIWEIVPDSDELTEEEAFAILFGGGTE